MAGTGGIGRTDLAGLEGDIDLLWIRALVEGGECEVLLQPLKGQFSSDKSDSFVEKLRFVEMASVHKTV